MRLTYLKYFLEVDLQNRYKTEPYGSLHQTSKSRSVFRPVGGVFLTLSAHQSI